MNKLLTKITTFTFAIGAVAVLSGCSCETKESHARHHNKPNQDMVMVQMTETMTAEMIEPGIVKAKMYTRNGRGGVSEMGNIKFATTENGMKMMVDVTDLRPGKDYTVKIYRCDACNGKNCCDSKCMNVKLPMLSVDEPERLTRTFDVSGIDWQDLNNAKIVLTRDGGYKASWGRVYPTMGF